MSSLILSSFRGSQKSVRVVATSYEGHSTESFPRSSLHPPLSGLPPHLTARRHRPLYHLKTCIGYLGYPFQNEQGESCVEHLACDVDKEEKIGVVVIISPLLENRYPK